MNMSYRNVDAIKNQVDLPVSDGIMVWQVAPGGAAANAGIRGITQTDDGEVALGDIIVSLDGEKIGNSDDLYRLLDKHQVGQTVSVELIRNGRRLTVPVRLAATDSRRGLRRQ
jgi:S1-C subfamily serine protease